MNYVVFLSVGVFASLLYVVGAHYDPGKEGAHDYTPAGIVAAIRDDQREQVLIAREKHGIPVNEAVVAAWEGEKLNRYASVPSPTLAPAAAPSVSPKDAFAPDAWFRFWKKLIFPAS